MTFGVVLISILLHGLTVSPLLRWLGIVKGRERQQAYEFARGKLQAASAALEELDRMSHVHFFREDVRDQLKQEYKQRIQEEQNQIGAMELDREAIAAQESQWARRHLLLTEKNLPAHQQRRATGAFQAAARRSRATLEDQRGGLFGKRILGQLRGGL